MYKRQPLDGVVCEGRSLLDTVALTGESVPREVVVGSQVLSGCINLQGVLTVKVEKAFAESTVAKILDLVENASSKKSRSENFISKFARYYTPIVVIIAAILAVLPPLLLQEAFSIWVYRALVFLVISCPCALVISVPLGFFGGIGGASKLGVLVKGSNYLEALAHTETVVFDKTGTLTQGVFQVAALHPLGMEENKLLELAVYAESFSNHPISLSLQKAYQDRGLQLDQQKVEALMRDNAFQEIAGYGVKARLDGNMVLVGNDKLMKQEGIAYQQEDAVGTIVYVALNGEFVGSIVIKDVLKPDAIAAIRALKAGHIKQTVMLTGDNQAVAEAVGKELGIDQVYAQLLPGDKVEQVEALLEKSSEQGKLVFVGDGVNDAPVLARADVGIAMGGLGSDAAIEAADVVIMTDEPSKLVTAIGISKHTLRIVKQNIVFALAVKLLVLLLGAVGIATMWAAVFADVGVAVIAILNAMRALSIKRWQKAA